MEHSRETGIGNAITSRSAETVSPGLEYNASDWGVSFGGSRKERDTNKKVPLDILFIICDIMHLRFQRMQPWLTPQICLNPRTKCTYSFMHNPQNICLGLEDSRLEPRRPKSKCFSFLKYSLEEC